VKRVSWLLFAAACGGGATEGATADPAADAGSPPPIDAGSGDAGADATTLPDAGARVVDPTTLTGKLMMGYQGWFLCPGDGAPPNRWVHWFRGAPYDATNVTFDMWPSTAELDADELCTTVFTRPSGAPAPLYSAWRAKTVDRHFRWMQDHDLDGVFLQRFSSELSDPAFRAARDKVLANVMAGAEQHGRVFAIEYDISGQDPSTLVATLVDDWTHLVDDLKVTASPRYLRHAGKPLLGIWGFGFSDRPGTPQQASQLVTYFKTGAPADKQVTLMGGVPREWRKDATWIDVTRSFDIINPWLVGAFVDDAGADNYAKNTMAGDIADATAHGREFMPVVFPGFSWKNLNGGPLNQIPRRAGRFYWRQAYNAVSAGSTMIFGAMFDEVDEGTAMYKVAPSAQEMPAQGTFLSLDADGTTLPDDWYLRLADQAGKMLRKEIPVGPTVPITPP
jgi:hypothetical protein